MALYKNPKYDLKRSYNIVLKISLIISLMLLILAFKFFPDVEIVKIDVKKETKVYDDVIPPPTSKNLPPPPPNPVIPIESPTDDILEDVPIESNDLFVDDFVPAVEPRPAIDDNVPEFGFVEVAEVMPEPIGGIGAIEKKITYPELAIRAGVQGRVYVYAYIDEKGNVNKVELRKGIGAGCDEEALIAVKNTLFTPGKQRGRAVRVKITVPVLFSLR